MYVWKCGTYLVDVEKNTTTEKVGGDMYVCMRAVNFFQLQRRTYVQLNFISQRFSDLEIKGHADRQTDTHTQTDRQTENSLGGYIRYSKLYCNDDETRMTGN